MNCPCGSTKPFAQCCELFLNGTSSPPTAEALMRSRYTAYVKGDMAYIKKTLAQESTADFDADSARSWAISSTWKGLKILSAEKGGPTDKTGIVEFTATYAQDGDTLEHHEIAHFRKNSQGQWRFVKGDSHSHKHGEGHHDHHHHHITAHTVVREGPKIGRNDPCPCGSGKKYKKCCAT